MRLPTVRWEAHVEREAGVRRVVWWGWPGVASLVLLAGVERGAAGGGLGVSAVYATELPGRPRRPSTVRLLRGGPAIPSSDIACKMGCVEGRSHAGRRYAMVWVKLDDRFAEHPKILALSDKAFRLHVAALCWCGRHLSDGVIPKNAHTQLGGTASTVRELLHAGLWVKSETGHVIHDYLKFNPTAAKVEKLRRERSDAGKMGAGKRWQTDSKHDGKGYGKRHENDGKRWQNNGKVDAPLPDTPCEKPSAVQTDRIDVANSTGETFTPPQLRAMP